ncbi:hypothetical protein F969_02363 [Acinetobacter variabilis]|uniref:Uncharacterized protein n=1 Tax=Acinetobacter variabilis TaxID=70346 RepID=N8VGW4_9GAMM|nr:hypothetical protein F969_02363 [Acinetobacter variabilis]
MRDLDSNLLGLKIHYKNLLVGNRSFQVKAKNILIISS